jgi:phage gp36-like protein
VTQYCLPSDLTLYATNALALQGVAIGNQTAACIQASSEADGYLNDRYAPPYFAPFPIALVMHVSNMAFYHLMQARGYAPDAGADDQIAQRYYAATYNPHTGVLGWLARVKRQEISIPDLNYSKPLAPLYSLPAIRTGGPNAARIRGWTGCR